MNKRNKQLLFVGASAALALSLVVASFAAIKNGGNAHLFQAGTKEYGLSLTKDNAYTSGSSQSIETNLGGSYVTFAYESASVANNAHVALAKGGAVYNTDQITSVTSLCVTFTGALQARLSYNATAWGEYFDLGSGVPVDVNLPYFVEIKAKESSVIERVDFVYSCVKNEDIDDSDDSESLIGVIDFWNPNNLGDTQTTSAVDASYVNANGYETVDGSKKTIAGDVSAINAYQKRYGGIGLGSSKNSGSLDIEFVSSIRPSKVTVAAAKQTASGSPTLELNEEGKALSKSYSTYLTSPDEVDQLTWTFGEPIESISLLAGSKANRVAIYRIYLYSSSSAPSVPDVPVTTVGFTAEDHREEYELGDVFDELQQIQVTAIKSDGSTPSITSGYTVTVTDPSGVEIDTSAPLSEVGTYTVTVNYGTFVPVSWTFDVAKQVNLIDLSLNLTKTTFTTAESFASYLSTQGFLTASITYDDETYNVENATYHDLATHGVTLSVIDKATFEVIDINAIFGKEGTYTVKIARGNVFDEVDITVEAIPVVEVVLGQTSIELVKGNSAQLTASVNPVNATNQGVEWVSLDDEVATVSSDGLVTAVNPGETDIVVSALDNKDLSKSCHVTVTAPVVKDTWTLVSDVGDLSEGDELVIGSASKGKVAGNISSQVMSAQAATFSSGKITSLPDGAVRLTLGGVSGAWTLSNEEGAKLGATAVKKLAWDGGKTTWSISGGSSGATIQSTTSSYGRFLYNDGSPRFTTYTSATSSSMLLPELYRGSVSTPIYATDISLSLSGTGDLGIGDMRQLNISYWPATTNQREATYISSNTNVVTVSSAGVLTGIAEGDATITVRVPSASGTIEKSVDVSVRPIAVTGVALSLNSTELTINTTLDLTATVSPANATNKNVTWSSSNTSVATVNSSGRVSGVSAGTAIITATTQDGNKKATCTVEVVEKQIDAYTIMIYMCGADLESVNGLATSDLKEILNVSNQPDNVNVIIETGGASKWKTTYGINASYLQRYHVANRALVRDSNETSASMGQASTLQSFLEWGLTEYPAQRTGVIFWNHGGALDGVCFDEKYDDDCLTNNETKTALTNAFKTVGRSEKLEWVGYDACLMAVQDIAEFNSRFFNYMVSSQESEGGYGWDYDRGWLGSIYKAPATHNTETVLTEICTNFIADNSSESTLSVMNLKNMATYHTAWESMASSLYSLLSTSSKQSSFRTLVNSCKKYGYSSEYTQYNGGYVYDIFDAQDLISKLGKDSTYSSLSSQLDTLQEAFDDLIVASKYTSDYAGSHGVNFFFPLCKLYRSTFYGSSVTNFSSWSTVCTRAGLWK